MRGTHSRGLLEADGAGKGRLMATAASGETTMVRALESTGKDGRCGGGRGGRGFFIGVRNG
jgi:hypothetical protein